MPTRRRIRRQLRQYLTTEGNWRLKALLLALETNPRAVAEAWPVSPGERAHLQARVRGYTPPVEQTYSLAHRPESREAEVAAHTLGGDDRQHALFGTGMDADEYISTMLRELASDAGTELDVLWREALTETVQAGAATRKIARETTTITNVEARKGDLPTAEQEPFATPSQEGAEPDLSGEDYTQTPFTCEKFEFGFSVSDNLVDAAAIDVIERQIRTAGAAVENAINRQYVENAIDNAANTNDNVGNEVSVQTVLEAAEFVSDADFDPVNVAVLHPEFMTELADDPALNYLNFSRQNRELQADGDGVPPSVAAGPELFIASDATYNGLDREALTQSNTWGWEAGGEVGAFVHGRPFVHTVVYRDVEVRELEPPFVDIHDVQGGVAAAQTDSVQPSNNAIASISQ